jgi:hypothetical protein
LDLYTRGFANHIKELAINVNLDGVIINMSFIYISSREDGELRTGWLITGVSHHRPFALNTLPWK